MAVKRSRSKRFKKVKRRGRTMYVLKDRYKKRKRRRRR